MIIRRFIKSDIPLMVEYSKEAVLEYHYKGIHFDEGKVSDMLHAGLNDRDFFCDVVVHNGEVSGAFLGKAVEFIHSRETYAQDLIIYILDEARSLKAINGLMRNYVAWAKSRRVRQIRLDQSTGFKMEKFAVLAKRAGFSQIGTKWNMEVNQ